MQVSDNLQAIIPIFDLNWWQLFAILLFADWGIILLIKFFEPLGWRRAYWKSALYGDIFLPVGIASAIIVTQHAKLEGAWYASVWWNWTVLAVGLVSILAIEAYLLRPSADNYSWSRVLVPSKIWHTLIFPVMFYLSVMTLLPLITTHTPLWAVLLSLFGYGAWLATYIFDLIHPPDHSRTH